MPRYVAFLRAVNVGRRIVKMDELRGLFENEGHTQVETFLATGNVVFSTRSTSTAPLERALEASLRRSLGYEVPLFVRSTAEVSAAAQYRAFPEQEVVGQGAFLIAFLRGPVDAAGKQGLQSLESPLDRFVARGREVYWLSTPKQSESKLTLAKLERALGQPATMRSMGSVGKLAAKHCGA